MKGLFIGLGLAGVAALVAIGLSQAGLRKEAERQRVKTEKITDPRLAAIGQGSGELQPGGKAALEKKLRELKGLPVVINVWASWCGPCKMEAPLFEKAGKEYGGRVGFIGVNLQDGSVPARRFIEKYRLPFASIEDKGGEIYDQYRLKGAPSTIIIDRRGRKYVHVGAYAGYQSLKDEIEKEGLGVKQK